MLIRTVIRSLRREAGGKVRYCREEGNQSSQPKPTPCLVRLEQTLAGSGRGDHSASRRRRGVLQCCAVLLCYNLPVLLLGTAALIRSKVELSNSSS